MKIPDKEKHRNADGTYNGVTYMAEMSGLSLDEVKWSFARLKELRETGHTTAEIKTILKREATERFGGMIITIDVSKVTLWQWFLIGLWLTFVTGVGGWIAKVIEAIAQRAMS